MANYTISEIQRDSDTYVFQDKNALPVWSGSASITVGTDGTYDNLAAALDALSNHYFVSSITVTIVSDLLESRVPVLRNVSGADITIKGPSSNDFILAKSFAGTGTESGSLLRLQRCLSVVTIQYLDMVNTTSIGSGAPVYGIYTQNCFKVIVKNCTITMAGTSAYGDGIGTQNTIQVAVNNCTLAACRRGVSLNQCWGWMSANKGNCAYGYYGANGSIIAANGTAPTSSSAVVYKDASSILCTGSTVNKATWLTQTSA